MHQTMNGITARDNAALYGRLARYASKRKRTMSLVLQKETSNKFKYKRNGQDERDIQRIMHHHKEARII